MKKNEKWLIDLKDIESKLEFFHSGTKKDTPKIGDKWDIPSFLKDNKSEWANVLVKIYDNPMSFPGSVSPNMGNLLRALIMNIAPKTILEIGSYIGVSSIWIASAMIEYSDYKKLYCVDLFEDHTANPWCPGVILKNPFEFVIDNIKECGFSDFVDIQKGDSKKVVNDIASKLTDPIDFAFIDGDHSRFGCMADFLNIEPYLATGGYILFHDVFPSNCGVDGPAYTLFNNIIYSKRYEFCKIYTSPLNFGFSLVRKLS